MEMLLCCMRLSQPRPLSGRANALGSLRSKGGLALSQTWLLRIHLESIQLAKVGLDAPSRTSPGEALASSTGKEGGRVGPGCPQRISLA